MEISTETASVATGDGTMQCFLARPAGSGKYPAVFVVMEAFGLNDHIKDVAKRVAAEGYVALAPDMYYRENGAAVGYDNLPEAIRLMTSLTDDGIVRDIGSVIKYLQGRDFARPDRIAITGFCMGGRISFLAATACPEIRASVPFYGGGIGGLLDRAKDIRCPMLLFFGDRDAFIPNDEVERIKTTLAKLGKQAEVKVYPGADHGFFCNERASYHPEAAADAWRRMLEFFGQHLK